MSMNLEIDKSEAGVQGSFITAPYSFFLFKVSHFFLGLRIMKTNGIDFKCKQNARTLLHFISEEAQKVSLSEWCKNVVKGHLEPCYSVCDCGPEASPLANKNLLEMRNLRS